MSPPHEAALFAARHYYDMVVVYDRSSTSLPSSQPPSTSSEAQRVLWNLTNAVYEREFVKPLRRQPLLLVGGWEAWEKKVGAQGIVGVGGSPRLQQDEADRAEAKRAHRRAAVLPPANGDGSHVRTSLPSSSRARVPRLGLTPASCAGSSHQRRLLSLVGLRSSASNEQHACGAGVASPCHASRRCTAVRPCPGIRPLCVLSSRPTELRSAASGRLSPLDVAFLVCARAPVSQRHARHVRQRVTAAAIVVLHERRRPLAPFDRLRSPVN